MATQDALADEAIAFLHAAQPAVPRRLPRYPGERVIEVREQNRRLGVPVNAAAWAVVQRIAAELR